MRNLFKASVLAVLFHFCSANVFAADAPTVSDAHELIGDLIETGLVYAVNSSKRDYVYSNYKGNGCTSSMNWGEAGDTTQIGWSGITSVIKKENEEENRKLNVTITGGSILEIKKDGTKESRWTVSGFYFQDEISRKRVEKAMTLLMNSCVKSKSKFD